MSVLGVAVIIPDATLVRLIDAPSLTTAMWRTGLAAAALGLFVVVRHRAETLARVTALGWWGGVSSLLWGSGTILFVVAVDNTAVANVLVILALSPLWAVLMTRLVLRARVPVRTLVALPVAVLGVVVAVLGSIDAGVRSGDVAALVASVGLAANLTIVRAKSHIDMVPAVAIGNVVGCGALFAAGTATTLEDGDLAPLLVLGVVVIPGALALITAGARHLSSPETTLLLVGETVLSPLLAAAVIDEPIADSAYLGGVIVVTTLTVHAWLGLRAARAGTPPFLSGLGV